MVHGSDSPRTAQNNPCMSSTFGGTQLSLSEVSSDSVLGGTLLNVLRGSQTKGRPGLLHSKQEPEAVVFPSSFVLLAPSELDIGAQGRSNTAFCLPPSWVGCWGPNLGVLKPDTPLPHPPISGTRPSPAHQAGQFSFVLHFRLHLTVLRASSCWCAQESHHWENSGWGPHALRGMESRWAL